MKPTKVVFVDSELENAFNDLSEKDPIKKGIMRAIRAIEEDAFAGRNVKKELIPKKIIERYSLDNLWIYNLPDS